MTARLLCVLDGHGGDANRIHLSQTLAARLGAKVMAVLVRRLPDLLAITDPSGSAFLRNLVKEADAEVEALALRLEPLIDPSLTVLERLDQAPGRETESLIERARLADLVIAATLERDGLSMSRAESLLFHTGRPCLFVPPDTAALPFRGAVIGWKNCREAALAVGAALPLLRLAETVHIASVEEPGSVWPAGAAAPLEAYLRDHGILSTHEVISGGEAAGPALRATAARRDADLIIMGGYGHSRLREMVMGGATLDVLSQSDRPVFMAH